MPKEYTRDSGNTKEEGWGNLPRLDYPPQCQDVNLGVCFRIISLLSFEHLY